MTGQIRWLGSSARPYRISAGRRFPPGELTSFPPSDLAPSVFIQFGLIGAFCTEKGVVEVLGTAKEVGTDFFEVIRVLRAPPPGLKATKFREVAQSRIDGGMASGSLVVCCDQMTYNHGHVIAVIGDAGV